MAETSGIAWTRSTFNPWIGCTKIGPGCDHCYAAESHPVKAFGIQWGAGQPRRRTGVQNWNLPLRWNRLAGLERETGKVAAQSKDWRTPGFWPVFCASLADVFDNEVPDDWRRDLFSLIEQTPNLSWLLVTKRIGNVRDMVCKARTTDWLEARKNVRLMITVCDQAEASRDIPKLLALNCKNGISYEPALGSINFDTLPIGSGYYLDALRGLITDFGVPIQDAPGKLQWIIVGGESNQGQHKARPFDVRWARDTVQQCKAAGVPVFVKQLGSNPAPLSVEAGSVRERLWLKDRAGADPSEWPEDLRVREFPR